MHCFDMCVSLWACVQCCWDVLVEHLTFCQHYKDWVLPPAIGTPCGIHLRSPPHLETFKPEATRYNLPLYRKPKIQCSAM